MMKIAFQTFGCKVNLVETENLKSRTGREGFTYVQSIDDADIIVVNSCAVTDHAERKSRNFIKKLKKKYPSKKIALTGCLAELAKEDCNADFVVTNAGKDNIFNYIKKGEDCITPIEAIDHYDESDVTGILDKTRGFLKIQDGCDDFCSYCIIPYLRGKPRSKNEHMIIDEFVRMLNNGFKEIVLVGIHIGKYGIDTGSSLFHLLKQLIEIDGNYRIRLSSIEINELSEDLIQLVTQEYKICKHLHIPLQSASNRILKLMNRKYTFEQFLSKITYIKSISPDVTIGSDVITGFPGETDEDFNNIYDNIYYAPIDYLHVFPYSDRKGTVAERMENKLDEKIKSARSEKLRRLGEAKRFNLAKKSFGKNVRVLTEKDNRGLTEYYLEVYFNRSIKSNIFVDARVIGIASDGCLIGEPLEG
jgi:threonylcarbamoyladenosine tRNA methylthiotransferase MtaB